MVFIARPLSVEVPDPWVWKNDGIGFVAGDSREGLQIAELHGPGVL